MLGDAAASEARTLITVTPNVEVNVLVAQLARSVFLIPEILVVHEAAEGQGYRSTMEHLKAERLFGVPVELGSWDRHIADGQRPRWQASRRG